MERHGRENGVDRTGRSRLASRVAAFVGGKGGIGKSNIALNSAIAMSRRGMRVILLDAAAQFAHVDIMIRDLPFDLGSQRFDEETPFERWLTPGPDGLRIARMGAGATCRHGAEQRVRTIGRLRREADAVVIDCGSGASDSAVEFALLSDYPVLTTTPEPTALTDAYATAKLLVRHGHRGPMGLVINMVRSKRDALTKVRRFQRAAAEFLGLKVEHLGSIPFDRHVVAAAVDRRAVISSHPRCAASASLERLSRKIPLGETASPGDSSVWLRVASLFL